jgi:SnoaL-like domain
LRGFRMPWFPDLFSAPVLERIRSQAADARAAAPVPYFAGVTSGETDALIGSFAGEPELHHPFRGRVKGRSAFERYVADTNAWLTERNGVVGNVERVATPVCGIEEAVVTLDGEQGRVELPVAVVADRDDAGRIIELRLYYGTWPWPGRRSTRPPLLQPDPGIQLPDVVAEYDRALTAGDVAAIVAAFEPDAYVREPAGGACVHRGPDELAAHYELLFSNGGGLLLEHCATTDNGRSCALEYNIARWGQTELPPAAGLAVFVRGSTGKLAGARIYDSADPPLSLPQ